MKQVLTREEVEALLKGMREWHQDPDNGLIPVVKAGWAAGLSLPGRPAPEDLRRSWQSRRKCTRA